MTCNNMMISIIVLTYNAEWEKLSATLISIISQIKINPQIIIADDGSVNNHENNIISLFGHFDFSNYKMSLQSENRGTVDNLDRALKLCDGKYVKAISPGDYFYNEDSLFKWLTFMVENDSKISFGDAIFYYLDKKAIKTINYYSSPLCKDAYVTNDRSELFIRYLLGNDTILGAALAFEKHMLTYLLNKAKRKLKYAEDFIVRIAVFENIKIDYFNNPVIWYEYGTGISTSNIEKWNIRILNDYNSSNDIILHDDITPDYLSEKFKRFLSKTNRAGNINKIIKVLYFPSLIRIRFEMQYKVKHENKIIKAVHNNFINWVLMKAEEYNASN